jgi:hypothetical protein
MSEENVEIIRRDSAGRDYRLSPAKMVDIDGVASQGYACARARPQ